MQNSQTPKCAAPCPPVPTTSFSALPRERPNNLVSVVAVDPASLAGAGPITLQYLGQPSPHQISDEALVVAGGPPLDVLNVVQAGAYMIDVFLTVNLLALVGPSAQNWYIVLSDAGGEIDRQVFASTNGMLSVGAGYIPAVASFFVNATPSTGYVLSLDGDFNLGVVGVPGLGGTYVEFVRVTRLTTPMLV